MEYTLNLLSWPHLRHLTLSWNSPSTWGWGRITWGSDVYESSGQSATPFFKLPILDDVYPPINEETGESLTLADAKVRLETSLYLWEYLKSEVECLLGSDEVADLGEDGVQLMRAWELRHQSDVEQYVRFMATHNLQLEQFDWYVGGSDCPGRGPRWRWRITRNKKGKVDIVIGDLTWKGCSRGDPPELKILVGQELACYQKRVP